MGKLVASKSFCFSSWAYRSKGKEEKETTKLFERDLEKSRKGRETCALSQPDVKRKKLVVKLPTPGTRRIARCSTGKGGESDLTTP